MLARLTAPSSKLSIAAFVSRVGVLATLLIGAHVLRREPFSTLAYAIATTSALQILLDPGTVSLIVVRSTESAATRYSLWRAGLHAQIVAGALLVLGSVGVMAIVHGDHGLLLAAGLGLLAASEGIARYARVTWQLEGRFTAYALIDVAIGVGRLATGIVLWCTASLNSLAVASIAWAVFLGVVGLLARPAKVENHRLLHVRDFVALLTEVWPYGLSTTLSAIYAQGPPVLLGMVGSLHDAALLSVATRITQPTELLPSAIAAVHFPRLSVAAPTFTEGTVFKRQAFQATALGVGCCAVIAACSPLLMSLFGYHSTLAALTLTLLALALPAKFLNYQLVTLAISRGRVRARMLSSGCVAVVAVAATVMLGPRGATPVAAAMLACELCLLVLLSTAARPRHVLQLRPAT